MVADNGSSRDFTKARSKARTPSSFYSTCACLYLPFMRPRVGMIRLQDWTSGTGRIQLAATAQLVM